ncbi:MAG: hypothetical protein BYD32DRAFT_463423 [Podila humilis]|nr:MAG: hypothetical protein BYD32DRAFT_463423 [Podila humilis]
MDKPKVLVVGAGIGGLFLGNLLHKAKVPFLIFERRCNEFEFIGVYPLGAVRPPRGVHKIGKSNIGLEVFNDERKPAFVVDFSKRPRYCGAAELIISRPDLHDLLLRQVPKENIHMGKKVLSFEQNDLGVMIRCNDNTSYHGDILVGADGAYSAVRQHLFKVLKTEKLLPAADEGALPFDWICLTPKDRICKVMLEEKVFTTWHSGRTVLLGDACHKAMTVALNPAGGASALLVIHDAVTLANWISTLHKPKHATSRRFS